MELNNELFRVVAEADRSQKVYECRHSALVYVKLLYFVTSVK